MRSNIIFAITLSALIMFVTSVKIKQAQNGVDKGQLYDIVKTQIATVFKTARDQIDIIDGKISSAVNSSDDQAQQTSGKQQIVAVSVPAQQGSSKQNQSAAVQQGQQTQAAPEQNWDGIKSQVSKDQNIQAIAVQAAVKADQAAQNQIPVKAVQTALSTKN